MAKTFVIGGELVADGKWVLTVGTHFRSEREWDEEGKDTWSESERTTYSVVGVRREEEVRRIVLERSRRTSPYRAGSSGSWGNTLYALVGDQTFGVIITEEENDVMMSFPSFVAARQIHKGELGRFPLVAAPTYVREGREPATWKNEDLPEGVKPWPMRRLKRHHARWAQLSEVAALAGMSHQQLLELFYPFADSRGNGLQAIFAASRDEIHGKIVPWNAVQRFTERDLPRLFERDPASIWVRQGFAKTVLCLKQLGYQPNTTAQAA
jgi:hypothetical protein